MSKIYDCVTFFQENLQMELRFSILDQVVDKFIVCESIYDHRGNSKKINFSKKKFDKFQEKIIHIVIEKKFPEKNTPWQNQAWQREHIFHGIKEASPDDYIMFSDPDEIPNPLKLKDFKLKKKFGIFFQKMFTYKMNLFNKYETPWEGTRKGKENDSPQLIEAQLLVAKRLLADPKVALAKRIDPNHADANGQTPLHHIAVMKERPATVALAKLLLASGGKAKVMDASGKRPSELGAGRATPRGELTALLKRPELLVWG